MGDIVGLFAGEPDAVSLLTGERLGQAKIQNLDHALRRDFHVGRFQVAMNHAAIVGVFESLGDLLSDVNRFFERDRASRDGTRLALTKNSGGADTRNIWLLDLSRGGASTRFTFSPLSDMGPVWSADGSRMIFSSNRDGPYNLYQKPTNAAEDEVVLLKSGEDKRATSWSRDGRYLLYEVVQPKTKLDLWVLPLEGGRKPLPFLSTEFKEGAGRFSPDGHWVAYTSNESGQDEVYVRSFSMNAAGTAIEAGGKWPISNGFGVDPRWRGDGRELYYRSRGGGLMSVGISTQPAFRAGNPQPLGVSSSSVWDSTADGGRFLSLAGKSGPQPLTVVLNWQAGLKK